MVEKHEFEDRLPAIYAEAMGEPYPGAPMDEHLPLGARDLEILQEITGGDRLHFELVRELLDVERRHRPMPAAPGCSPAWSPRCAAASTTTPPTPPDTHIPPRDTLADPSNDAAEARPAQCRGLRPRQRQQAR